MRSTPIILDKLRHIKYDLQAVWDMDQLIDGGYKSILSKEVTPELVKMLLWFGLKSEDPDLTMEDAGKLIGKNGANCFITCLQCLFDDGWFWKSKEPESEKPQARFEAGNKNVLGVILDNIKLAEISGVASKDAWGMSPIEIKDRFLAIEEYRMAGEMAKDYRMGTICAWICNANGIKKKSGGNFIWSDFVPGMQMPAKPQTSEEMQMLMLAAFGGS